MCTFPRCLYVTLPSLSDSPPFRHVINGSINVVYMFMLTLQVLMGWVFFFQQLICLPGCSHYNYGPEVTHAQTWSHMVVFKDLIWMLNIACASILNFFFHVILISRVIQRAHYALSRGRSPWSLAAPANISKRESPLKFSSFHVLVPVTMRAAAAAEQLCFSFLSPDVGWTETGNCSLAFGPDVCQPLWCICLNALK